MRATCQRVHERLARDGLVYRYQTDDGLPPGEGGICSFWAVECRARGGDGKRSYQVLNDSSRAPTTLGSSARRLTRRPEPRSGTSHRHSPTLA